MFRRAGTVFAKRDICIREFPYPYRAGLSICNDIDETKDKQQFIELQKYLSSDVLTSLGPGLNLEIGNSLFMYSGAKEFSYYSTDKDGQELLRKLVKSGYIDCLHACGSADLSRDQIRNALSDLKEYGLRFDTWIDHAKVKQNIGKDSTSGFGDVPASMHYHMDLTVRHGIRFVWLGSLTPIVGQETCVSLAAFCCLFDTDHIFYSSINVAKEICKYLLGRLGSVKYALHARNNLAVIRRLVNGQKVFEFGRFDNYWKGVSSGGTADRLAYLISSRALEQLKNRGGYSIVYTHLAKTCACERLLPIATQEALRNLAEEFKKGNIYVTTTSRLLHYWFVRNYLEWSYEASDHEVLIRIHKVGSPIEDSFVPTIDDIRGISFYVPGNLTPRVFLAGREIVEAQRNGPDYAGKMTVMIPLKSLEFPLKG